MIFAAILKNISEKFDVPIFSKAPLICDLQKMRCDALTERNEKMFRDHHHYTLEGARRIGERLVQQGFGELLK